MIETRTQKGSRRSFFLVMGSFCLLWPASVQPCKSQEVDESAHYTGLVPDNPVSINKVPHAPRYRAFLPEAVDLTGKMPPPGDQGRLGSCTSWATAYAARSYYTSVLDRRPLNSQANIPSPLYVWQLSHSEGCNGGSSFLDAISVLSEGALSMSAYPYGGAFCDKPSLTQRQQAHDFLVKGSVVVDSGNLDDIRGALAAGNPVLFAVELGRGWGCGEGLKCVRKGYLVEGDGQSRSKLLRHAMVFVGYDDKRKALRVQNSWGPRWGDHGYAWMSYNFVHDRKIDEAMYLTVDASELPHPQPTPTPGPVPSPTPPRPAPQPLDLSAFACSRLERANIGGRDRVTGFVQSSFDLKRIRSTTDLNKTDLDIRVMPFPLCEAALTLKKPLADPDRPEIDTFGRTEYRAGDILAFNIRSTESIRYLYVFYFSHDGDVQVLSQPSGFVPSPALPRTLKIFGDGIKGRQKFTVSAPFGDEMIVALSAKSLLFDRRLPTVMTERSFLSELRQQLVYKPNPSLPDREVSASMKPLVTAEARQP